MAPVPKGKQLAKGKQQKSGLRSSDKSGKSAKKPAFKKSKGPPPVQQKTKSAKSLDQRRRKKREYTAEELNIPKLNMITPVGVQKPRGKKKGKVFVDDPHTMQTILAIVNAETEGKIESKMLKARHMEEIREARQREMEAKEQERNQVLENKKNELRGRKRTKKTAPATEVPVSRAGTAEKPKKKVSFG